MSAGSSGPQGLSPAATGAIVLASCVAVSMLNVAPAAELQFQRDVHLSASQIGVLDFAELAAMGLATWPSYWWMGRGCEARVARWAYALFVAGSLGSILSLHFWPGLLLARLMTGAGAGTLMVLSMTLAARSRDPGRLFALVTVAQLASGAALLYAFPALAQAGRGLRGIFGLCTALGVMGMWTASAMASQPHHMSAPQAQSMPGAPPAWCVTLRVMGLVTGFNIVLGGLWAFVGEYAAQPSATLAGTPQAEPAAALAGATLAGMLGAGISYLVGGRWGHRAALLSGYLTVLAGVAWLHAVPGASGFAVGADLLCLGWNFCVPQLLAAVAASDCTGRSMSTVNLAFALGLAIGPLLAGTLIDGLGLPAVLPFTLAGLAVISWLTLGLTRTPTPAQPAPSP